MKLITTLVSAHLALADGYLKLSQPALAIQALRAGTGGKSDRGGQEDQDAGAHGFAL